LSYFVDGETDVRLPACLRWRQGSEPRPSLTSEPKFFHVLSSLPPITPSYTPAAHHTHTTDSKAISEWRSNSPSQTHLNVKSSIRLAILYNLTVLGERSPNSKLSSSHRVIINEAQGQSQVRTGYL
jgi:hypothetical protein